MEYGLRGQSGHLALLLVMMELKPRLEPVPTLRLPMEEINVLEVHLNLPVAMMGYVMHNKYLIKYNIM